MTIAAVYDPTVEMLNYWSQPNSGISTGDYDNPLNIFGSLQMGDGTNTVSKENIILAANNVAQATIQSTATTPIVLLTLPISTAAKNITAIVNCNIQAIQSTGAAAAYSLTTTAAAFYNGSAVAAVGTLPTITFENTSGFTVAAAWSVSGNNLLLTVTGVSTDLIEWKVNYQTQTLLA